MKQLRAVLIGSTRLGELCGKLGGGERVAGRHPRRQQKPENERRTRHSCGGAKDHKYSRADNRAKANPHGIYEREVAPEILRSGSCDAL